MCATQSWQPFTGLKTDIPIGKIDGESLSINIAIPKQNKFKPNPILVFIYGLYPNFDSSVAGGIAQSAPIADFSLPKYRDYQPVQRLITLETDDQQA